MKVKATDKFRRNNVYPVELQGHIPEAGEIFELTEVRAKKLCLDGYVEIEEKIETAKKEPVVEKAVKKTTKKSK